MDAFCRDCGADAGEADRRCRACGSPRLLRHPAADRLSIAHVDCDAFYAAVEKRDNPALADKPVIIGGGRRGVVSTACYVARTYGVRSAMPMFKALAACPQAVVIRPNMEKYATVGRQVRERMLALTPLVEPLSIDEAFMDLTGTQRLHGLSPARALARFAREVEREIGISVSIGLSANKFLAKIASDLDKPRGFAVLAPEDALGFLAEKPVGFIWGVGKATQERLARDGFRRIADLQRAEETDLMRLYGTEGRRLWRLARGQDTRIVSPDREMKSISAETTFDGDIADPKVLERELWLLCEKVSARLKARGVAGSTITLKLKTADFRIRTRARSHPDPTRLARRLFEDGRDLLMKEADGTRFRLIGIGVSDLSDAARADPADLVNAADKRAEKAELAVDRVRARFGSAAMQRGLVFEPAPKAGDRKQGAQGQGLEGRSSSAVISPRRTKSP
jgi:DNA polymerase-4